MKAEIETIKQPEMFAPIKLTIILESVDEARSLWHQLNTAWPSIIKEASINACALPPKKMTFDVWCELGDYMTKHNLMGV